MFTSKHSPSNFSKQKNIHITLLLCLSAFAAARLCFWLLPELLQAWDAKVIDGMFLFRSSSSHFQPAYDDTIVHVDINDTSIRELHSFYLNREHYAKAIQNMAEMDVSAQIFDFIFAARTDESQDLALVNATEKAGNVYFGLAFNLSGLKRPPAPEPRDSEVLSYLEETKWHVVLNGDPEDFNEGTRPLMTFPDLAKKSRGLGFLNLNKDPDGINRRIPLLIRYQGAFYPSLGLRSICDYLKVPPEKIVLRPGKSITLQNARHPGETMPRDIEIPIDRYGNIVVNLVGPWERMKHYNFADIFYAGQDPHEMEMWREELAGKIVVVSEVATGTADVVPVPTDTNFLASGLHANVLHSILQGSFLKELSPVEMLVIETALLMVIFLLSLNLSTIPFSIAITGVSVSFVVITLGSFLYFNLIFEVVRPLLMLAFSLIGIVVYNYIKEAKDRIFIQSTFGSYLSNEVVEELLGKSNALKMGGETREVTFLVSDLRGFTALSSQLSPGDAIRLLNRYLETTIETITHYRGTVNDLQGDGILVFFGAPLSEDDDLERAVACAVEMQNRMPEINAALRQQRLPEISMGIGINSGEVVVGNIGSRKFRTYTALGDPVNTAYRIESHSTGGQILMSDESHEQIKSIVLTKGTLEARFKGLQQPLTLHEVYGIRGSYEISLSEKPAEEFINVTPPLSINCFGLKGKTVDEAILARGHFTKLGKSGAEAILDGNVDLHADLKIDPVSPGNPGALELYAKVILIDKPSSGESGKTVRMAFTSLSEETRVFFEKIVRSPAP
jgi:adenylate cyclase